MIIIESFLCVDVGKQLYVETWAQSLLLLSVEIVNHPGIYMSE